jgi:hypothetical protein
MQVQSQFLNAPDIFEIQPRDPILHQTPLPLGLSRKTALLSKHRRQKQWLLRRMLGELGAKPGRRLI